MVKRFFQLAFIVLILLSLFLSLSPGAGGVPLLWNDKMIHCMSYFVLIMALDFAWRSGKDIIIKSIMVLVYSCLIEYGQSFVPGREMSLGDMAANASGIILFLLVIPLFKQFGVYGYLKLT